MQAYCGCGIRHNKGNEEKIMKAVWVIYYHMILGPSYENFTAQHFFPQMVRKTSVKLKKTYFMIQLHIIEANVCPLCFI